MKRLLNLLICLSFSAVVNAQKKDTVRFYYVLENPKYYGLDKARSWFEIDGLKDQKVQNRINDTLRKSFLATTEFTEGGFGTTKGDDKTPNGYTDYTFFNGNTYGDGWVRFKDSDSLLYLKEADGYYGAGVHLGGFWSIIAEGKMAYIQIDPIAGRNTAWFPYANVIQFAFSLTTGNVLPLSYRVAIDLAKKDSLSGLFDRQAATAKDYDVTNIHDCAVKSASPMPDSVTIGATMLIMWFRGEVSANQHLIERKYTRTCQNKGNQPMDREFVAFLNFKESMRFLKQEDWMKLQTIYQ